MRKLRCHIATITLVLGFLLGVKGDFLAIWAGDDPLPIHIFSCRVSSLPPADQLLLRRGLTASDSTELTLLLEDYL